jgi:hypothetical protein
VRHHKAPELHPGQTPTGGGLSLDEWVRAVVAGADERSQRWKHLVVLGGLLIGIGSLEEQGMDLYWASGMKKRVEAALVRAANLALVEVRERHEADGLGGHTITLVMNHSFGCLSVLERGTIDYDRLLPVLIGTAYFSNEGFQSAYFLGGLDLEVTVHGEKLDWPVSRSPVGTIIAISNVTRRVRLHSGRFSRSWRDHLCLQWAPCLDSSPMLPRM